MNLVCKPQLPLRLCLRPTMRSRICRWGIRLFVITCVVSLFYITRFKTIHTRNDRATVAHDDKLAAWRNRKSSISRQHRQTAVGPAAPDEISSSSSSVLFYMKQRPDESELTTEHLMTWFTTFKETPDRDVIQYSTLINRGKFVHPNNSKDSILPVLFLTNTTRNYESIARANGWHVHDVPRVNEFDTPFISDMISLITQPPYDKSMFYGFANGDILFDDSLIVTLKSLAHVINANKQQGANNNFHTPVLIVGRRTDTRSNFAQPITELFFVEKLRRGGVLHALSSADYFFFTADFDWHLFDGLVIARPAYDNYILLVTKNLGLSVIDATKTLTAVHLAPQNASRKVVAESWGKNINDTNYNRRQLSGYVFERGVVTLAPYETDVDLDCPCLTLRVKNTP